MLNSLVLLFPIITLFPLQVCLCFKVHSKLLCALPDIILLVLVAIFTVPAHLITGYDALIFIVLAIYSGYALAWCLAAWVLWIILCTVKKKKSEKDENRE